MGRFLCTLIIIASGCLGLSAHGGKIYKWVDQQGVTHYSEQAPTDKKTETVRINPHQAESESPQPLSMEAEAETQQPQLPGEADLSQQQLPTEQQKTEEQKRVQQQKTVQQQNCATAQQKLRALKNAGRVRQLDADSGEYIYLPDEVKLAQIQQMSDYLRDKCRG